jgi:hypothetical protein
VVVTPATEPILAPMVILPPLSSSKDTPPPQPQEQAARPMVFVLQPPPQPQLLSESKSHPEEESGAERITSKGPPVTKTEPSQETSHEPSVASEAKPPPAPLPTFLGQSPPPVAPTLPPWASWHGLLAIFIGSLPASAVALASTALGIAFLGRRLRQQLETALVRVEVVQSPGMFLSPAPVPPSAPSQPGEQANETAKAGNVSEPQPERILLEEAEKQFALGPTFEEEQQRREEAQRQQEEAVLRQVVEENLALRQQLERLRPESRLAPEILGGGDPFGERGDVY